MGPADLEQIFTSCKLEIVVPDGEFHLPESFSSHGLQWLHDTKQDGNVRDVAFFAVTIPSDCLSSTSSSTNQGNSDADAVPARLALFLAHLQVSMDLSYVPPVPSPTPNPPPNSSPHLQLPPAPHQSRTPPSHGVGPVPLQPPHTPSPIPATTGSDTAYASARNVESSPVVHSYIWGETRDVVDSERRFSVFLQHEEDGDDIPKGRWVLVYRLDVPVVYVPTRFANPLLCLTASATLREKRVRSTPERESLMSLITPIVNKVIPPTSPKSLEDSSAEDLMDGFEEVNLFEGIIKDRRTPNSQFMTPTPRAGSIPTLRKSFRKVLAAVSGIRVRMRTTFVPYFVIPGTECDEELEERRDAGNEERTVILSLEVENVPDSGRGFEVERVDVSVGGEGAKAQLIRWGPAVEKDEDIFPLRLRSADQYNLLYAVSFVHPHALDIKPAASNNSLVGGNTLPESHRPMSIVVTGRPWVPEDSTTKPPSTLPPVKTFTSRWSSILDLTATGNMADPYERPPSPLSEQDTLPMPASPFPLASPTSAKPMTSMSSLSSFTLDSPVSLHGKAPSTPIRLGKEATYGEPSCINASSP
ncbi:hypothetical protein FRB99_003663 [Tulasnella sp. 403]|nr:hypothetical protein FRB99_003663 [Tulasnella sp. 403]